MRIAALGSGSKGNGMLVEHGATCLLVDCGFSMRKTVERLQALERTLEDITAILVTHEHSDHIKGVQALSLKGDIPVYLTHGTARHRAVADLQRRELVRGQHSYRIGDIDVRAVTVPHDAKEPCQYLFEAGGRRAGLLTDLGHVTPQVQQSYSDCDFLFVEANHDEQMLAQGSYPPSLKQRVGGRWGHLSNRQARAFLEGLGLQRLHKLVVGHISEQNNTVELAAEALRMPALEQAEVSFARQDTVLPWIDID